MGQAGRREIFLYWLLATAGGSICLGLATVVIEVPLLRELTLSPYPSPQQRDIAGLLEGAVRFGWTIIGAVLGASLQAIYLERRARLGIAWLVATSAAAVFVFFAVFELNAIATAMAPFRELADLLPVTASEALLAGVVFGIAQWWVLRRLRRAALWLVAVPVIFLAQQLLLLGLALTSRTVSFLYLMVSQELVGGLVAGVTGGLAMTLVLGRPKAVKGTRRGAAAGAPRPARSRRAPYERRAACPEVSARCAHADGRIGSHRPRPGRPLLRGQV